jgi:hypothetical protein
MTPRFLAIVFVFNSASAVAFPVEKLPLLTAAVREYCVLPDRAGSSIHVDGNLKAGLPVVAKFVKADLKAELTYEQWNGFNAAIDKYKMDPRECSVEALKVILPYIR